MKEKMLKIALKMLMSCIKGADGHEVARTISKQLTLSELGALSGTFKEAEYNNYDEGMTAELYTNDYYLNNM